MDTSRFPLAPAGPLPELAEFLAPFHVHFARSEGPANLGRYCTGLLTEHPNTNCDTLAQVVPDTSEQSLQGLLTSMKWDEADLDRQRVRATLELPTEGDAPWSSTTPASPNRASPPSACSGSTPAPWARSATV